MYVLYIVISLLALGSFALLVRHSLRWLTLRKDSQFHLPFGLYLVQSPLFAVSIGMMSVTFGVSGMPGMEGASLWPWSMPWWVGVAYGAVLLVLGAVQAVRAKRQRGGDAPAFDERTEAIGLRADKVTLWTLYLYLLSRGIFAFGSVDTSAPVNLFYELAINPWFQSIGFLWLTSLVMHGYFQKRMS